MDVLTKESSDRARLAKFCKYIDMVPNWLMEQCGRDEILCNWPLRQISKKPKHSQHPVIHWSKSYKELMLNQPQNNQHAASSSIENSSLTNSSKSPRILNEFNSNSLINSMVLSNSRKITNAPAFPDSGRSKSSGRQISSTSDLSEYRQPYVHIPTFGQIINNRLYSVPLYSNQQVQDSKFCSIPMTGCEERIKREVKKYLLHCVMELGFSSPLNQRLYRALSIDQHTPKTEEMAINYERYCSTNSRYPYLKPSSSTSSSSTTTNQFKPSRTLRSNTIIDDKPVSSSSHHIHSDEHVHDYSFSRRQRYRKWSRIEDRLGKSWNRRKRLKKLRNERHFSGSQRSTEDEGNSSPSMTKKLHVINLSDEDDNESDLETNGQMLASGIDYSQTSSSTSLNRINSLSPCDKRTFYKANPPLSSECGYEIIFEPIDARASIASDDAAGIVVHSEADFDKIISGEVANCSGASVRTQDNSRPFVNNFLIPEDIVIRRLKPIPEPYRPNNKSQNFKCSAKFSHDKTIEPKNFHGFSSSEEDDEVRVVRISEKTEWKKEPPSDDDVVLVKVIDPSESYPKKASRSCKAT